jgi:hypothetical protein
MHKQNNIYTCNEYYSAFKRMEILSHAVTQVHLEDLVLNEIASHKKTNTG